MSWWIWSLFKIRWTYFLCLNLGLNQTHIYQIRLLFLLQAAEKATEQTGWKFWKQENVIIDKVDQLYLITCHLRVRFQVPQSVFITKHCGQPCSTVTCAQIWRKKLIQCLHKLESCVHYNWRGGVDMFNFHWCLTINDTQIRQIRIDGFKMLNIYISLAYMYIYYPNVLTGHLVFTSFLQSQK